LNKYEEKRRGIKAAGIDYEFPGPSMEKNELKGIDEIGSKTKNRRKRKREEEEGMEELKGIEEIGSKPAKRRKIEEEGKGKGKEKTRKKAKGKERSGKRRSGMGRKGVGFEEDGGTFLTTFVMVSVTECYLRSSC
jgi:hypothetical protein